MNIDVFELTFSIFASLMDSKESIYVTRTSLLTIIVEVVGLNVDRVHWIYSSIKRIAKIQTDGMATDTE